MRPSFPPSSDLLTTHWRHIFQAPAVHGDRAFLCGSDIILQPHLRINPGFLLWLGDPVARHEMADEKRRLRIVLLHGCGHGLSVSVCIAVPAEVSAAVVGADIARDIAGAFLSVIWSRRQVQILTDGGLERLLRHASGAVGADRFKNL